MFTDRRTKKILKAIKRQQAKGISQGDICPRCGKPAMKASGRNESISDGIFVCSSCFIDASFATLAGDQESYSSWAAFSDEDISQSGEWHPHVPPVKKEVLPRFEKGDRLLDVRSDWPGTVSQILPQGLYVVHHDGDDFNEIVLKDKEVCFEVNDDIDSYIALLRKRIPENSEIRILSVASTPGSQWEEKAGTVRKVTDKGTVEVVLHGTNELAAICPDADIFQLLGEPCLEKADNFFDFVADDVTIDF